LKFSTLILTEKLQSHFFTVTETLNHRNRIDSKSGHLSQSTDPKIAADLRPSADESAVRTSLVAAGG